MGFNSGFKGLITLSLITSNFVKVPEQGNCKLNKDDRLF